MDYHGLTCVAVQVCLMRCLPSSTHEAGIILEEATSDADKCQLQTHRSSTRALPLICGETRAKLLISAESVVLRSLGASTLVWSTRAKPGQTQAITLSTRSRYSPLELPLHLTASIIPAAHLGSRPKKEFHLYIDTNTPTEATSSRQPHRQPRQATSLRTTADVEGYP